MTVAELSFSPRTTGRSAVPLSVELVRELTPTDLELLGQERGTAPSPIQRISDRHHTAARCCAQGMKDVEVSAITGYTPSRLSILRADPAFAELVAHYRAVESSSSASFVERANALAIDAMNEIGRRLEENPDEIAINTLLEITKSAADRSGNAPVQKNFNVNVNGDLASRMDAARRRRIMNSTEVEVVVISSSEGQPGRGSHSESESGPDDQSSDQDESKARG